MSDDNEGNESESEDETPPEYTKVSGDDWQVGFAIWAASVGSYEIGTLFTAFTKSSDDTVKSVLGHEEAKKALKTALDSDGGGDVEGAKEMATSMLEILKRIDEANKQPKYEEQGTTDERVVNLQAELIGFLEKNEALVNQIFVGSSQNLYAFVVGKMSAGCNNIFYNNVSPVVQGIADNGASLKSTLLGRLGKLGISL